MVLLYTEFLYTLYLNSGKLNIFFFLALFAFAVFNYKFMKNSFRWAFLLFGAFLIFEVFPYVWVQILGNKNGLFINHLYVIASTSIQSIFYYLVISDKTIKSVLKYALPILVAALIFQMFYNEGYLSSPALSPLKNFVFIIINLLVQRQLVVESKGKNLRNNPLFWFNIAFLLLNTVNLIVGSTINYILPISDDLSFIVLSIRNFFDPISCVLWMISIYKLRTWKFKPAAFLSPSL